MLNIEPAGHRILIKVKKVETMSPGGIVMTTGEYLEHERYSQEEGTVVGIGPTAFKELYDGRPWCEVGDVVLVNKHSGVFKTDKETKDIYRLVNDQDILGIVRSE